MPGTAEATLNPRASRFAQPRLRPDTVLMSSAVNSQSWATRWRQRLWRLAPADRGPIVLRHRRIYILPTRRGRLALGRVTLSTDFPLGLWRGWAYVHFPVTGIVYPAPEAPAPHLPPGLQGSDFRRSARAADAELAGLRDYHSGDPLNRIAWKAVARGAGWYTKQFEGSCGSGTLEFHWAELPPGFGTEARLSRLAAWILAAEREARAFGLTLPGVDLPAGSGAGHRRAALCALALFPPEGAP